MIEDVYPTDRAVRPALARRHQTRRPWSANHTDEHEPGIGGRLSINSNLILPDLVFANHLSVSQRQP
jgi:hypothetical protein